MSKFRLADYLGHLKECAERMLSYVEGMTEADFMADQRTQQAVLMNLMVFGETATRIHKKYSSFIEKHQELPWRQMSAMRNRIAHGYFEIEFSIVWQILQENAPQIIQATSLIHVDEFDVERAGPAG